MLTVLLRCDDCDEGNDEGNDERYMRDGRCFQCWAASVEQRITELETAE